MQNFLKQIITLALICTLMITCLPGGTTEVQADVTDSIVTYTPNTITKGLYTTPIWNQHKFWKKHSGAARHGCGICTTSMALMLNGVASNPNIVLKENGRSVRKCKPFRGEEAAAYIRSKGIPAFLFNSRVGSSSSQIQLMKNALQNGKVIMAMVQGRPFSGGNHWVLITGFTRNGRIVVANSSYGCRDVCKKTGRQYHLVKWSNINQKLIRFGKRWCRFIIIGK